MLADTFHMDLEGQDAAAEIERSFDQLRLVHLADRERQLPGDGGIDFAPALRTLRELGYDGWYGFECNGPFTLAQLREATSRVRRVAG